MKQIWFNLANNDIKISKCNNYEASKKYHKKDAQLSATASHYSLPIIQD